MASVSRRGPTAIALPSPEVDVSGVTGIRAAGRGLVLGTLLLRGETRIDSPVVAERIPLEARGGFIFLGSDGATRRGPTLR